MPRLRARKGFTFIMMWLLFVVFVGAAAFATEFGRMYLIRGQLQAAADAGALAGIFRVVDGGHSDAVDTARAYTRKHIVGTALYDSSTAVVTPGVWQTAVNCGAIAPPCFDASAVTGWDDGGVKAVQVIVNFTGQYGVFGRALGLAYGATNNSRNLVDTAVAVRQYLSGSTCTRPFAVPYQTMLNVLYPPDGTKNAATYSLTEADIATLRTNTTQYTIKSGNSKTGVAPTGEFYATDLPPGQYANGDAGSPISGGSSYSDFLGWNCGQVATAETNRDPTHPPGVSVGDWLQAESGNMSGPTKQGVTALCGSTTCSPPFLITTALWDTYGDVTYCKACFHVKYIGAFAITGVAGNGDITGYFRNMATSVGPVTTVPSPIQRVGLVK